MFLTSCSCFLDIALCMSLNRKKNKYIVCVYVSKLIDLADYKCTYKKPQLGCIVEKMTASMLCRIQELQTYFDVSEHVVDPN
jgi:hypothetical protein